MKFSLFLAIAVAMCGISAWGQAISTAQIKGTVQDPTGAVIPGAEVKLTQTDTGLVRTATTETDGSYVVTTLPIGPYRLEVSKAGFSKCSRESCCRWPRILLSKSR
jgi:hypothetical protein